MTPRILPSNTWMVLYGTIQGKRFLEEGQVGGGGDERDTRIRILRGFFCLFVLLEMSNGHLDIF